MKDDLILKKYKKEKVNGTFNLLEEETFFLSKIMDVEDNILLDEKSVQYFNYINIDDKNDGYQNYELNTFIEDLIIVDMVKIKKNNHTIIQKQQNNRDKIYNTRWEINLNVKNMLIEYLFAKIKERRTFKSITYDRLKNENINQSIYDYIRLNLLDRYEFDKIDFYVKYENIKNNSIFDLDTIKTYNPQFKSEINLSEYKNNSVNVKIDKLIDNLMNVKINYNQSKPSTEYTFSYYFNIYFKKI